MTVQELIEELQQFDPNQTVRFSYNYGDHWRTHVAPEVQTVSEEAVKFSAYHDMHALDDDGKQTDVILS